MKVNPQDPNQASLFMSNSPALEVKKAVHSEEQLNSELARLAEDTYHKNQHQEPDPTYNKSMTIVSNHVLTTPEIEKKALLRNSTAMFNLYMPGGEVSQSVEKMFSQYDEIMAEIRSKQPELFSKDWGISMNQSGELEITGQLSNDEKAFILEKLNANEDFVSAAKDFRSSFLAHLDFGTMGWSDYEVNESNFSTVFDLKEILNNSQGGEDFKKAWNKDFSWLELNDNISAQLKRNAEKKLPSF
ncbi:hypothetical protein [Rheinheimera sp. 1928-s]|uniref:hypothetical protein n=1 Tax=Rheinheimera sp. 1928-s TaxID=3033803 RepID=UPI00261FF75A|nr:hypothetical protein [Rheinheimera sp. 1928-s]